MSPPDRTEPAASRPMVRALARQEALDGLRGRRALLLRAVTPLLLFGVVLVAVLATRGTEARRQEPYVVAVQGDQGGASTTLSGLGDGRIRFEPTDDAVLAAADRADLGIIVPDHLDHQVAAGNDVNLVVYRATTDASSRAALAVLRAGLTDARLRSMHQAAATVDPGRSTSLFTIELTDVARTARGTQTLTAGLVPALLVVQAALLVNGTATRLLGRRARGLLPAQLMLPWPRHQLARAKGWAELAVGLVAGSPVLVAVVVFTVVIAVGRQGWVMAVAEGAVVATAAVVLGLPMVATGLLVGTAARTQEQVTLATAAALILAALVAAFVALGPAIPPAIIAAVPVAGLVGTLRTLISGDGGLIPVAVAMVTTAAMAAGLARLAGRRFDSERLVLRGG